GPRHLAQIAIGCPEPRGGAIDERRRRRVADETARELGGNQTRRRWLPCEDVEHLLAVGLAAARFDHVAEHDFLAGIVEARIEPEAAAKPRVLDRPPREGARDLGHVLLRVAAVHAERVQLHQLAAVVLVETPAGILALWRAWRRGQTPRHHEAAERTP